MFLPSNTKYLFIDMNSFFASCEQQTNPAWRHKPVAVTPINTPNGCIVSASYEAKTKGIKTGTLIEDARVICSGIIIVEANVKKYLEFNSKLIKVLYNFSPFVTVKSVDEAVIKLSPSEQNTNSALALARQIKDKIYQNLGEYMRSSIGIGPNVWLAKMAAESKKPNGLVEVKLENLAEFYESQKLTDLKGIAGRTQTQLNYLGIITPMDLYLSTAENLRKKLGICGEYWYLRMHGYDTDTRINANLDADQRRKSISQSHVLEPLNRRWDRAWQVCQKLVERAAKRLRDKNLQAEGVGLGIRVWKNCWHKTYKTSPFSDSQTCLKLIKKLWDENPIEDKPLKIGIHLFNLSRSTGYQQKIFPKMQRLDDFYKSIDKINDRYGAFTIKPANLLGVDSAAPVRISFGQPIKEKF